MLKISKFHFSKKLLWKSELTLFDTKISLENKNFRKYVGRKIYETFHHFNILKTQTEFKKTKLLLKFLISTELFGLFYKSIKENTSLLNSFTLIEPKESYFDYLINIGIYSTLGKYYSFKKKTFSLLLAFSLLASPLLYLINNKIKSKVEQNYNITGFNMFNSFFILPKLLMAYSFINYSKFVQQRIIYDKPYKFLINKQAFFLTVSIIGLTKFSQFLGLTVSESLKYIAFKLALVQLMVYSV